MKIELGKNREKKVHWNTENVENKNIAIFGLPGTGKSTEEQKIAVEVVAKGGTVLMFDIHQVLDSGEIFWKYKQEFDMYLNEIPVYEKGISCNLFEPLTYSDGMKENPVDTMCAVIDVLDRTLKLGCAQKAALRIAITYMVEEGTYEKEGFKALDKALERMDTSAAEAVRDKLYLLTVHNIFHMGSSFIQEGKINVIRLSKFDLETQEIVTEMILAYIWRMAIVKYFKQKEIFVFVDEFQNLPSGKKSALSQLLSEGRKFGVNMILATQRLPQSNISVVHQRLQQSSLILYFKPSVDQVRTVAKMIDQENAGSWTQILLGLKKGEFVAFGTLEMSGHQIKFPLKVSAYEKRDYCSSVTEYA